jgi:hypothetical protein
MKGWKVFRQWQNDLLYLMNHEYLLLPFMDGMKLNKVTSQWLPQ